MLDERGIERPQVLLRAADTVTLAERLRMTRAELVTELYAIGALAD